MTEYAAGGDLLAAYGEAWRTFDGDAWVALFAEHAEYHEDPFGAPLVGHNAIRAYLLEAATSQRDVDFTVERHWVSGETVLAAWHAAWTASEGGGRERIAGFLIAELAPDGRIETFREWTTHAPGSNG